MRNVLQLSKNGHLLVEAPAPGVCVVRFARPDLRGLLDDGVRVHECALFRELQTHVLASLGEGETLVLNLGLVEFLPSLLLNCLLQVREAVKASRVRLVLCRLSPEHEEVLEVTQTRGLFRITPTESQAVREALPSARAVWEP
jgi:anti-anti-sigma factor